MKHLGDSVDRSNWSNTTAIGTMTVGLRCEFQPSQQSATLTTDFQVMEKHSEVKRLIRTRVKTILDSA